MLSMAMELRNRVVPVFELAVELFGDLHPSDKGFLEGVAEDEAL